MRRGRRTSWVRWVTAGLLEKGVSFLASIEHVESSRAVRKLITQIGVELKK